MFQTIMLGLSLLIFTTCLIYIFIAIKVKKLSTREILSRLIAWVAASLFPLYIIGTSDATGGVFDTFISSLLGAIRVLAGENSLSDTREFVGEIEGLEVFVANYTAVLHLISATLLVGLILTLFRNLYSKLNYTYFDKGKLCIFTEISERSILLAENVHQIESKTDNYVLVFLGKIDENNYQSIVLKERIAKVNAYIFDTTLEELKIHKRFLKRKVHFFLFKNNEEDNLKDALLLHHKYGENIISNCSEAIQTSIEELDDIQMLSKKYDKELFNSCLNLFKFYPEEMLRNLMITYENNHKTILAQELNNFNEDDTDLSEALNLYQEIKIKYEKQEIIIEDNSQFNKIIEQFKTLKKYGILENKYYDIESIYQSYLNHASATKDIIEIKVLVMQCIEEIAKIIDGAYDVVFKRTLRLYDNYRNSELGGYLGIYILSTKPEAVVVTDAIKYPVNIDYRIINEANTLIYKLFNDKPLFLARRENRLKILIVGAENLGITATKIAAWCAQTHELYPEIIVVDSNPLWENKFAYECPELAAPTRTSLSEKEAKISFYTVDIQSDEFIKVLEDNPEIGYVICSLGDDELNLNISMKIRQEFDRIHFSKPENSRKAPKIIINVLFNNEFLYDISNEIMFDNRTSCDLNPFGQLKEIYKWDNIVSPYLDNFGKAMNRCYARDAAAHTLEQTILHLINDTNKTIQEKANIITEKIKVIERKADLQYNDKEYGRNSSIASGMHCKYKLYTCLVEINNRVADEDKKYYDEQLWNTFPTKEMINDFGKYLKNPEVIEILSQLEHRRWNVYMRSEGWRTVAFEIADNWNTVHKNQWRNFTAKLSACIATWDQLDEVDQWMKEKYNQHKNFKELDRVMVRDLCKIMIQASAMDDK